MSRGLGKYQRLMLQALRAIEDERGREHLYAVSAIVGRAYELSPELQAINQRHDEALKARDDVIRPKAASGDAQARLYLSLTRALSGRSYRARPRVPHPSLCGQS